MNGDWLQVALILATLPFMTAHKHPLGPWAKVGSSAFVFVNNPTQDTILVTAEAPSVDNAIRVLSSVPPLAIVLLRSPYLDAEVTIRVGPRSFRFTPSSPGIWDTNGKKIL